MTYSHSLLQRGKRHRATGPIPTNYPNQPVMEMQSFLPLASNFATPFIHPASTELPIVEAYNAATRNSSADNSSRSGRRRKSCSCKVLPLGRRTMPVASHHGNNSSSALSGVFTSQDSPCFLWQSSTETPHLLSPVLRICHSCRIANEGQ